MPVLWDQENKTIVNTESAEILRMFNSQFNEWCPTDEQKILDLYPEGLRSEIDDLNDWILRLVFNIYLIYLFKSHCTILALNLWGRSHKVSGATK